MDPLRSEIKLYYYYYYYVYGTGTVNGTGVVNGNDFYLVDDTGKRLHLE